MGRGGPASAAAEGSLDSISLVAVEVTGGQAAAPHSRCLGLGLNPDAKMQHLTKCSRGSPHSPRSRPQALWVLWGFTLSGTRFSPLSLPPEFPQLLHPQASRDFWKELRLVVMRLLQAQHLLADTSRP